MNLFLQSDGFFIFVSVHIHMVFLQQTICARLILRRSLVGFDVVLVMREHQFVGSEVDFVESLYVLVVGVAEEGVLLQLPKLLIQLAHVAAQIPASSLY